MLPAEEKRRQLRRIHDLAREAVVFEGGVTFQDDAEILIVGDWALLAYDEEDHLALSFHRDAHPVDVARLTRFLVEHEVDFLLYEAFVVKDRDENRVRVRPRGSLGVTWVGPALAGFGLAGALVGVATWVALGQPAAPAKAHPGKAVYDRYCASCHGEGGKADGPAAATLPIKPPPFSDGRLMNALPDDFLFTVIGQGAGAVGLAPQMPAFKPPLTDGQIRDVIAYVRTMADPPYRPRPAPAVAPVARAPAQPIEFSHVIHAGSYRIDCQYCHADARRSPYAGLPSVERCMGCHKLIAAQGNPEVQKIHDYWQRKAPIPWVRIHKVSGFVYFTHKRHIQVGLTCQTCHGPVEQMQRVAQLAPLTMGWCVECHAQRRGPLDCIVCHH